MRIALAVVALALTGCGGVEDNVLPDNPFQPPVEGHVDPGLTVEATP